MAKISMLGDIKVTDALERKINVMRLCDRRAFEVMKGNLVNLADLYQGGLTLRAVRTVYQMSLSIT